MNLFGAWEVGAPKVGAPSSDVMSPSPLFIGDAPDSFWLRFLDEPEKGRGNHRKKSEKILRKRKKIFE